jgi:serine phosphatase RsbU (regulator of sigma subunit)
MLRDITSRRESDARLRDLLQERTRIAATLQSSLRPSRLPDIPGCELAAHYEAAGGLNEIGGDFYDVFRLGPGQWGLVLGDVSGKGVNAAATTSLVRYTLRTLALEEPGPTRVLTKLNDALMREGIPEQFCTAIYAVCRVGESGVHLRLCLAGHHPALLRRADGRVVPVGRVGSALGLFPSPVLHEVSVHLRHGDLLCMFTDGLTEARNGPDLFGAERVAELLADNASTPQLLLDRLAETVRAYQPGPLTDDVALLVVKAPAQPPVAAREADGAEAAPRRPVGAPG